jgi:hypothetical protein
VNDRDPRYRIRLVYRSQSVEARASDPPSADRPTADRASGQSRPRPARLVEPPMEIRHFPEIA